MRLKLHYDKPLSTFAFTFNLRRYNEVYVVYFKTNKKCLREYPNISNYIRVGPGA
jgi:glutathionyl-hydroquinone reductase